MEQILQKNKKTFPVWNIIKKNRMVYNFRKQRWTRGYKQYKETSGLIEWKECQIFHSIFT